jgi:hypothetical protein
MNFFWFVIRRGRPDAETPFTAAARADVVLLRCAADSPPTCPQPPSMTSGSEASPPLCVGTLSGAAAGRK